ncbi:MAG: DHHW family protein [Eubacteriales bacterium]
MKCRENKKKNRVQLINFEDMVIIVMIGVWIFLIYMNMGKVDTYFSESENRILMQKPKLEWETVLSGEYGKEYESYLNDQFVARNQWISLKTSIEKILGKQESNGVYFGKDGSLLEKHQVQDIEESLVTRKIEKLVSQVKGLDDLVTGEIHVMMIPTADTIQSYKLPAFATVYDQYGFLEELDQALGDENIRIPVEEVLENHKEEYIYYRSDHHWTTLGAFYAYQQWKGGEQSEDENKFSSSASVISLLQASEITALDYERTVVSDDFLGTLHAKINIPMEPDQIEIFELRENDNQKEIVVDYVYEDRVTASFYEWSYLETKDQYGMFLDGNHPLIHIQVTEKVDQIGEMVEENTEEGNLEEMSQEQRNSILVVKNSYANCFIPFLTAEYTDIYVIDPRFNRSSLDDFVIEKEIDDVLYLYDVINYIRNF